MTINPQEEYDATEAFYNTIREMLDWSDDRLHKIAESVSGWSPAQHIYHISVANGMMLKGVGLICQGHEMMQKEGEINKIGRWAMENGTFPRGKAKAPKGVVPPDAPSREELDQALTRSRQRFEQTEAMLPLIPDAQGYFPHVFFGDLDAAQWLRCTRIHSEHHLTIIQEIDAAD